MSIEVKVNYIEKNDAGHLKITQPKKFHKDAKYIESIFEIEKKRFVGHEKYSLCVSNESISLQFEETDYASQLIPPPDLSKEIFDYIANDMAIVDQYVEHVKKGEETEASELDRENKGRISKLQSLRSKLKSESLELTHESGKKVEILPSPKLESNEGKIIEDKLLFCTINTPEFLKSRSATFKTTNDHKNVVAELAVHKPELWDDVIELGKNRRLVDITLRYKTPRPNAKSIIGELISIEESKFIEQDLF
ncbi:hypothetical protein [Colwellia sp. RSH04]|uniref:hypothetical protein n=1 Tax=Colwellia sp. RSH04 TaxID=2305464 RepID=UPI000E56D31D|nr:hypothetical protein [Colwellia sp. RSH04]RHW75012.1 hypothetical protein D1094_15395 [Colwellia sp. RSH04]